MSARNSPVLAQALAFEGDRLEARAGLLRCVLLFGLGLLVLAYGLALAAAMVRTRGISIPGLIFAPLAICSGCWSVWLALAIRPVGRPTLELDARGLRHSVAGEIDWQDVVGIALGSPAGGGAGQRYLHVGARSRGAIRQRGLAKWLAPMREQLRIGLSWLDQPQARVLAAALELRDRVDPPRLKSWVPGMGIAAAQAVQAAQGQLEALERLAPLRGEDPAQTVSRAGALLERQAAQAATLLPLVEAEEQRRLRKLQLGIGLLAGVVLVVLVVLGFALYRFAG